MKIYHLSILTLMLKKNIVEQLVNSNLLAYKHEQPWLSWSNISKSAQDYSPKATTMGPRYNLPLYNEDPAITNDIFQPSNGKMYGKEPWYNAPQL